MGEASRRIYVIVMTLVVLSSLTPLIPPAYAERFHVTLDGTRTFGPSEPGNWAENNCYSTIERASLNASPQDTVLLSRSTHSLDVQVPLPRYLGVADFSIEGGHPCILLGDDGGFLGGG